MTRIERRLEPRAEHRAALRPRVRGLPGAVSGDRAGAAAARRERRRDAATAATGRAIRARRTIVDRLAFPVRGGGRLPVLDGIDLDVAGGGIVALIGPNGCGKSTLLRVIAGLLAPERGASRLDGSPITGPDPRIGLVFQEPRLLPWRSAADNITYPLELAGWPRARRDERLATLIDLVGLDPA